MIPRFMGSQPRAARKVRLLKSSGRPLPSTSLRRDEAAKEPENLREDGIDVDLLSKIVKEILEKLGVMALIVEETAGSSRSRRGPTKQAKAIKAQQSRMTKEEDLWWKVMTLNLGILQNTSDVDADNGPSGLAQQILDGYSSGIRVLRAGRRTFGAAVQRRNCWATGRCIHPGLQQGISDVALERCNYPEIHYGVASRASGEFGPMGSFGGVRSLCFRRILQPTQAVAGGVGKVATPACVRRP